MYNQIPFKEEHLKPLMTQKINAYLPEWVANGHAKEMEKVYAFTGLWNGEVLVCGGITKTWPDRGFLWCIFSETSKRNFMPLFRGLTKFLEEQPFRRVEMAVPYDFAIGHRRAKMFGFEVECQRARKFLPDGTDCTLYVRLKPEKGH